MKINDFLSSLCADLENSSPSIEHIHLSAPELTLRPDRAIWLGLAASELIANSAKHAYPVDQPGDIHVELKRLDDAWAAKAAAQGGILELSVGDGGVGLPVDFSIHESSGLGMKIVHTLVRQLDGELLQKPVGRGTLLAIRFPARGLVQPAAVLS